MGLKAYSFEVDRGRVISAFIASRPTQTKPKWKAPVSQTLSESSHLRRAVPLYAYVTALVCGGGILAALPVLLVGWDIDQRFSRPMVLVACAAAAAVLAYAWPALSWRWGVWLSAALWLFFGSVFVALWINGIPEWQPLLDAGMVLVASCAGAVLGARLESSRSARTA
jgi:hypothetical protein